jgi:hypothetical protein
MTDELASYRAAQAAARKNIEQAERALSRAPAGDNPSWALVSIGLALTRTLDGVFNMLIEAAEADEDRHDGT